MNFDKVIKHIVFWGLFLLLWSVHDLNYHKDILANLKTNIFTFIPYTILVYLNLYVLMPKFLLKKKIISYVLILILAITIITIITSYYLSFYFKYIDIYLPTSDFFASIAGKIAIVTEVILSLGLSMTLFLTDEWYRKDQSVKEIEQKQLETELNLLKNQINPHFLFNSLNSIYIMLDKNLKSGKKMLLQFSEILSHQLYEANKKSIELEHEFENLTNYIDIEKVRHEDLVTVKYSFPDHQKNFRISPMLLLPLVENAFKHGQSSKGYWIHIESTIEYNNTLSFKVENTVSNENLKKPYKESKGIGLANVKRRLELIYPNKHLFNIECSNAMFIVHLKIQLNENEMFNS
ncbi:histidine kinase [Aquimarina sp. MAR_2010_214]|uniref:sensor histidine kinase n=1 Tax=Aquimarina sp. MAR_2010_214 TaxID=1250026 RepID=UPI000C70AB4A|nr:histidine kinase [Aquimarina sp. MAR_2010_214]PKV51412.1 histidine kinase [Aquimarina sp. MAR_2010_214]